MNKLIGIYKIVNFFTKKVYIGQTNDLSQRYRQHFSDLKLKRHKNIHLQNSYNMFGKNAFEFNIIETILLDDKNYISLREQYWIDEYKSLDNKHGYNLQSSFPSCTVSEETKKKISKSQSGELSRKNKLSWEQVNEIRKAYSFNNISQNELAKLFSVTRETIRDILLNRKWKDEKYIIYKRKDFLAKGEAHNNSKLSQESVEKIRELYKTNNYSYKNLAKEFNVSSTNIMNIIKNKAWNDIDYKTHNRKFIKINTKLTWEKVREIRELYKLDIYSQFKIADMYNVSRTCIQGVVENRRWKEDLN